MVAKTKPSTSSDDRGNKVHPSGDEFDKPIQRDPSVVARESRKRRGSLFSQKKQEVVDKPGHDLLEVPSVVHCLLLQTG